MRAMMRLVAAAAAVVFATAAPGAAQNYDARHQVRTGVFGQWGIIRGDARLPASVQDYSFSTLAVGVTAGIEQVRKESWSYGIEIDGAVHSGEEINGPARYGVNYSTSLRLRAGRHIAPDVLWYGTLGLGALGAEIRVNSRIDPPINKTFSTKAGFIIGTGIERDFGPGVWFAEYLFANYRAHGIQNERVFFDSNSHMLRLGVKFKVGHDHYHDDILDRIGRR